ncbi:hypothetical protein WJX81_005699 [Elliptochloris bilobata]|uniref:ENT domain-containing protein n=1 Tax=Elliptochloris bilobata TaxID=381761 RepID=A0AAW1RBH4_9CHLO
MTRLKGRSVRAGGAATVCASGRRTRLLEHKARGLIALGAAAMLAASAQLHGRSDFGGRAGGPGFHGALNPGVSPGPHERLSELREEAYCKVLRVFVAQRLYDLNTELMLSKLRAQLHISDDRHLQLRQCVVDGDEQPWLRHRAQANGAGDFQDDEAAAYASMGPPQQRGGGGYSGPHPGGHPASTSYGQQLAPGAPQYNGNGGVRGGSAEAKRTLEGQYMGGSAAGSGGKPGRKRLKRDTPDRHSPPGQAPAVGGAGSMAGLNGGQRGGPGGPSAAPLQLDPLVGYKVQRYWPQNGGWFEGIISDYNLITNEHCIMYDAGTESESFEWYRVRGAPKSECRLTQQRIDILSLPHPPAAAAAAPRAPAPMPAALAAPRRGSAGRKGPDAGGGRGRGSHQRIMAPGYRNGATKTMSLSGFEGYPQAQPAYQQPYPQAYAQQPAPAQRQYAVVSSDDDDAGYSPRGSF